MTSTTPALPAPDAAPKSDVLWLPATNGAAVIARRLLGEVAQRRARLADENDRAALHDFRVALRRLRSWLRAFRPELDRAVRAKARRRLRRMARESNESRDGEVQLAWLREQVGDMPPEAHPGLSWLVERIETRKRAADDRFRKRLDADFDRTCDALDDALASAAEKTRDADAASAVGSLSTAIAAVVRSQADRLRHRLGATHGPQDHASAHRARIAGKRLRYVLEPVADALADGTRTIGWLKALQNDLGELHDACVLVETVADALAELAAERGKRLAASVRALEAGPDRLRKRGDVDLEVGLLMLAERLHERAAAAFATARDAWLGARGEALLAELSTLADRLEPEPAGVGLEIERKYLLRVVPAELRELAPIEIEQGYLPGTELVERLRHIREDGTDRWFRTVKYGQGLVRTELEEEVMPGLFTIMWPLTEGRRLRKRRYVVTEGSLTWEIDEFLDRDLVLAEVELPSAYTPAEPPAWMAPTIVREVTGEAEFANEKLAR